MAYPTTLDDNTTMPPKNPGDIIPASENNAQIAAIKALEAKVGINSSAVTTSLDYQMENHAHTAGADDGGVIAHSSLSALTTGDPHTQYILKSIATTKGDILVATGSGVFTRLGAGTNGYVLTADSTQTEGVKWAAQTGGTGISITWQEGDVSVLTNASSIDFGAGFDLTESPAGEVNIALDAQEVAAAPVAVGTANSQGAAATFAPSDHVHLTRAHDHSNALDGQGLAPAKTFALTGEITPTQLTSSVADYNPSGLPDASGLRLSSDASRDIQSLAGGTDGRLLLVHNIGSFNIVLKNQYTTGTTADYRFAIGADQTIGPDQSVLLQYDSGSLRWRMVGAVSSSGGGGGGAPTTVNYLVGTSDASLASEIVVGTTPGGELGGTWAAPTIDSVHSGTAHHAEDHTINGSHHTGTFLPDDPELTAVFAGGYLTADCVYTSTTTLSTTGTSGSLANLALTIGANEVWSITYVLYVTGLDNATTQVGVKFDFSRPTGCTGVYAASAGMTSTNSGGTPVTSDDKTTRDFGTPSAYGTDNLSNVIVLNALAVNGSTAGTLQIQAAQNASNATSTTIKANSHFYARRII